MRKGQPARATRAKRRARPLDDAAVEMAIAACQERKAVDGLVLDLHAVSDATDFFIIVSGTSDTHVRAIAEHVIARLREVDVRPYQVEGMTQGRWVLVDYVDFVVHVFHPTLRAFYQLEVLWGDAPQRKLPSQP
ncbi:MAG: ribosome silencing factor [Gemmatimonadales bacterium]